MIHGNWILLSLKLSGEKLLKEELSEETFKK